MQTHYQKPNISLFSENKMCSQAVEPDPELLALLQHPPPNINAIKANNLDEKGLKNIVRARKKFFKATQQIEKGRIWLQIGA